MASNMVQRVLFALVAIPIALVVIWYGGVALTLLVAVAGMLGTAELNRFARQLGIRPFVPLLMLLAAGLPTLAWLSVTDPSVSQAIDRWWPFGIGLGVMLVLVTTLARLSPDQHPLGAAAVTIFAPLYAAGLPAFLLPIRHARYPTASVEGAALVFFPLVIVWICDSVAMGVGKRLGGPRLAPRVSPGKTWSGTIGGFVGALVVAPLYQAAVFSPLGIDLSPWQGLALAAAIGSLGQVGDLAESLLKREVGFKDSSHLIPGHGGVLDRLDSLYFAIPLAAFCYRLFGVI